MRGLGEKIPIFDNEITVQGAIDGAEIIFDYFNDFDDILTQKLHDKWWNPPMSGMDDSSKVLLPNPAIVVTSQQTIS